MSFWSKFGKIAGIAGAGAASLATLGAASPALGAALGGIGLGGKVLSGIGNAAGAIGNVAGAVSPIVGGLAKGRAEGRQAETSNAAQWNQLQLATDQARNQAMQQEFANRLGLVGTEANLLSTRAEQARRGDLQANVQDVVIPDNPRVHVAHWSGGVRPSALGPNAREAGRVLSTTALGKMNNEGLPTAPTSSFTPGIPMPRAGVTDKIIGAAGPALSMIGAVSPYLNQGRQPQRLSTPGAPILNPADIALGRRNNPALMSIDDIPPDDDYLTRLRGE